MNQFSLLQKQIIKLLQDGQCLSGSALGKHLNVSRTAIWKQINQLIGFGLPIRSLNKQGYQLTSPLILLEEEQIHHHLKDKLKKPYELHLFASLDSSNRYLKEWPSHSKLSICCTETQTQGRGRFGRHWHSPLAENIYCSSRWQLECDLSKLSGLSLVVSLAIIKTLDDFNISPSLGIKWPNDILWEGKKLCGSLIEIMAETHGNAMVIIGIGLNVNSDTEKHPLEDKPWCSLFEITQTYHDRNLLISALILKLDDYLSQFMKDGFEAFQELWSQYDVLAYQGVTVNQPRGELKGIAQGVNQAGELIIIDDEGTRHELSIGETSLSPLKTKKI